ncbi:MAG: hypothetical protein V3R66_03780, partial [Rhodospirillales bacterium]
MVMMTVEGGLTMDQAAGLAAGPFGEHLRGLAAMYVAPLFWQEKDQQGNASIRNGTMFFLEAGEGPFAVTARHVYQGYRTAKS